MSQATTAEITDFRKSVFTKNILCNVLTKQLEKNAFLITDNTC